MELSLDLIKYMLSDQAGNGNGDDFLIGLALAGASTESRVVTDSPTGRALQRSPAQASVIRIDRFLLSEMVFLTTARSTRCCRAVDCSFMLGTRAASAGTVSARMTPKLTHEDLFHLDFAAAVPASRETTKGYALARGWRPGGAMPMTSCGFGNFAPRDRRMNGHELQKAHQIRDRNASRPAFALASIISSSPCLSFASGWFCSQAKLFAVGERSAGEFLHLCF